MEEEMEELFLNNLEISDAEIEVNTDERIVDVKKPSHDTTKTDEYLFNDDPFIEAKPESMEIAESSGMIYDSTANPESRARSKILKDLHEAQANYDQSSRRLAAIIGSDGLVMAKGQYERSMQSYKHRIEKLQQELKSCDNND